MFILYGIYFICELQREGDNGHLKEGDFLAEFRKGIYLNSGVYTLLMDALKEDVNALVSAGSTDYSLLLLIRSTVVGDSAQDAPNYNSFTSSYNMYIIN
jgi:hypothetical protein